ncbi:hypothetical protein [Streptomyces sp. NPDC005281]
MGGGVSADPHAPGDCDAALGEARSAGGVDVRTAPPSALAAFPLAQTAVSMIPFRP